MRTDARAIGAGVAGGLLFGIMMTTMGMMEMVAGLMGSESIVVGWIVHLAISVIFGAVYAVILGAMTTTYGRGAGLGAVYGLGVWVLGPLLIMPLWMGMSPFVIEQPQINSLIGHAVFGLVLGVVYAAATSGVPTTARART